MRFRLAVCAEAGGVLACGRREAEHGHSVSGAGGVVDEPRQLRGVLAADAPVRRGMRACSSRLRSGGSVSSMARRASFVPERYGTLVQGENP